MLNVEEIAFKLLYICRHESRLFFRSTLRYFNCLPILNDIDPFKCHKHTKFFYVLYSSILLSFGGKSF